MTRAKLPSSAWKRTDDHYADKDAEAAKLADRPRKIESRSAGHAMEWRDAAAAAAQRAQRRCHAPKHRSRIEPWPWTPMQAAANATARPPRMLRQARGETPKRKRSASRARRSSTQDSQLAQAVQDRERAARQAAETVQPHIRHARHRSWSYREPVRRAVRYRRSPRSAGAREKLAKISGIVLAYPDLRLGHRRQHR